MIKKEKHTCKMFKYKIRRKGIWRERRHLGGRGRKEFSEGSQISQSISN